MPPWYLGIDLGGTKFAAGVVDPAGRVLGRASGPTSAARGDPIAACLRLSREAMAAAGEQGHLPIAVGIGLPGPTDPRGPTLVAAPSLPELEGLPLGLRLEAALGAPVVGDNDARAAALGEARFGAGQGMGLVAYFTISTGIGGGIVDGGVPVRGAHGFAAEFGHQCLEPGGDPCACGSSGCLETIASGPSIARRAQALVAAGQGGLLADPGWRGARPWDAELVAAAAREGDPAAIRVWEEAGVALGRGVATVIALLDPDCVVLGGGVMQAADLLLPLVRRTVQERAMPRLARAHRVVPARLGADTGIVGAAALAMIHAT